MPSIWKPLAVAPVALVVCLASGAQAQHKHRKADAHVHGNGTFDIAVEGNRVSIELEAPGMDIVGFEHAAKSAAQQAAVTAAKKKLEQPLDLFKLPDAAKCKVTDAKVNLEEEQPAKADAKSKHSHSGHKADESHSAFRATYVLDCEAPAQITSIAFDYFKAFKGADALTINLVSSKGQKSLSVSRKKPTASLGGLI